MERPNYFAILPANVRYDKNLTPHSKLLYAEITALCNERGYCWAGNEHFASLYKVSKRTVINWINNLIDNGYIETQYTYKEGTKEIDKRIITLSLAINKTDPITGLSSEKNFTRGSEKNFTRGGEKNFTDNNTSFINNTFINNTDNILSFSEKKDDTSTICKEIIDYLNQKANTKFRHTSKETKTLINARLKEKYTIEDFKRVIDIKCSQWLQDPNMCIYLRPKTLFGTKFESYLNEKELINQHNQNYKQQQPQRIYTPEEQKIQDNLRAYGTYDENEEIVIDYTGLDVD